MSMPTPGNGFAPQLHLSIPSTTTSFKRSFEQFGFDLDDSPTRNNGGSGPANQGNNTSVGGSGLHAPHTFHHHQAYGSSSLAGMAGSPTGASIRRDNERNKRARSASSGTTTSSGSGSRASDSSSSSSARTQSSSSASTAPMDHHRHRTATAALPPRSSLEHPPRLPTPDIDVDMPDVEGDANPSLNFSEPYRLSLQSFHGIASPTSPPMLPPLLLEAHEESVFAPPDGDRQNWEESNQGVASNSTLAVREAPEINGNDPPRIHIDLPQPSLTPLITPEDEESNEEESTNTEGSNDSEPVIETFTFYSDPDPPTLPPIPTADLFIDDDGDDSGPTAPPSTSRQHLDDHVPPSPSLHELRQWIDDAASPSADSDSSISGLARSDVADQGTSRVIQDGPSHTTYREEYRFPSQTARPTSSVPSHVSGPSLQRLHESWQDFTSRMLQEGRSRSVSPVNGTPTLGRSLGADGGSPNSPNSRRWTRLRQGEGGLSSLLGNNEFLQSGRASSSALPTLTSASSLLSGGRDPGLSSLSGNPPSEQNAVSANTSQGHSSRITRPPPATGPFNRRFRRRLSLFDDDDDDMDGDQDDESVAVPNSRALSGAPPRFSTVSTTATSENSTSSNTSTHQAASSFIRRRPNLFRPLEVDLGGRHESTAEELTRLLSSPGDSLPRAPPLNADRLGDSSSSSDESELITSRNPYSGPFTFSSSARYSLPGNGLTSPSSSTMSRPTANAAETPPTMPHRHYHPRHVSFRSSSSSLVAESPIEARNRDLTRYLWLGDSSPATSSGPSSSSSLSTSNPGESHSGVDRLHQHHPPWLDSGANQNWGWRTDQETSSSLGANNGSVTEEDAGSHEHGGMMQIDDRESSSSDTTPTAATQPAATRLSTHLQPVQVRDAGASNDTPVYLRDRYGNPVRYSSTMRREQTAGDPHSPIGGGRERTATAPTLPGRNIAATLPWYLDYDATSSSSSSSENSSASSPIAGPGPYAAAATSTIPEPTSQTANSFLPAQSLPSPNLGFSSLGDFGDLIRADDDSTRTARASNGNDESTGLASVPRQPTVNPTMLGSGAPTFSPGLMEFLRGVDSVSWEGDGEQSGRRSEGSLDSATLRYGETLRAVEAATRSGRPLHPSVIHDLRTQRQEIAHRHGFGSSVPIRSATDPSERLVRGREMGADVEMDNSDPPSFSQRSPFTTTTARDPPLYQFGQARATAPSSAQQPSYLYSTRQTLGGRAGSTTSGTSTDRGNSTEDGELASRFIPGPYRNTMRLLEEERSRDRERFYYPRPPTPPSPRASRSSPAVNSRTSAWTSSSGSNRWGEIMYDSSGGGDVNPAPPASTPASGPGPRSTWATVSQYLNRRSGLTPLDTRAGRDGGSGPSPAAPTTTAPQPPQAPARTPLSVSLGLADMERRAYQRHNLARPPAGSLTSPPDSRSYGAPSYAHGLFTPGTARYALPTGAATSGSASTSNSTQGPVLGRRFPGAEQTRPFNQAIESLREPTTAGPSAPMSSAEVMRRRRSMLGLDEGGVDGSGNGRPPPNRGRFRHRGFGDARRRLSGFSLADFMRDEDFDQSYEGLLTLGAIVGEAKPKGTPGNVIETMEKGEYKDWATAESDKRCPICLDDYNPTDPVMKLNHCSHWLHHECLEQWLQGANTCPVCRHKVHGSPTIRPSATTISTAAQRIRALSALSNRRLSRREFEPTEWNDNAAASSSSASGLLSPPTAPQGAPSRRDRDGDDDATGTSRMMSEFETLYRSMR